MRVYTSHAGAIGVKDLEETRFLNRIWVNIRLLRLWLFILWQFELRHRDFRCFLCLWNLFSLWTLLKRSLSKLYKVEHLIFLLNRWWCFSIKSRVFFASHNIWLWCDINLWLSLGNCNTFWSQDWLFSGRTFQQLRFLSLIHKLLALCNVIQKDTLLERQHGLERFLSPSLKLKGWSMDTTISIIVGIFLIWNKIWRLSGFCLLEKVCRFVTLNYSWRIDLMVIFSLLVWWAHRGTYRILPWTTMGQI
jgi:hypothetical protein